MSNQFFSFAVDNMKIDEEHKSFINFCCQMIKCVPSNIIERPIEIFTTGSSTKVAMFQNTFNTLGFNRDVDI